MCLEADPRRFFTQKSKSISLNTLCCIGIVMYEYRKRDFSTQMHNLLDAAVLFDKTVEYEKEPKICLHCGSYNTYVRNGKTKGIAQWYSYGKNNHLCSRCYRKEHYKRQVNEAALRQGYRLQMEAIL